MIIYTNTKSKVKPKLKSKAERDEYAAWCAKYETIDTKSAKRKTTFAPMKKYKLEIPRGRETPRYPSLNPENMGMAVAPKRNVYTGDKMLGIGTLHKSNAVPVFSSEEAQDIAKMRR